MMGANCMYHQINRLPLISTDGLRHCVIRYVVSDRFNEYGGSTNNAVTANENTQSLVVRG